jgi:cell division protein FtsN
LLWCDTKVVIGCNQYYKDYDACYTQWLKTPNIVEPRCLRAAPKEGQSDFGSASRIPEAVTSDYTPSPVPPKRFHDRHPDNINAPPQQAARSPAVAQPAAGPTDYVVQVATFRSESEAAGEFRRLQFQHPQFLGTLQQRIQRVELGASRTFYRLGLGPLSTKDQAHGLCKSLIAAGEKDCLVRRQ